MPLIKGKSPEAFKKNIKAEMHAGKPQSQAVAIAFAMKRRAEKKKMAEGGTVTDYSDVPLKAPVPIRQLPPPPKGIKLMAHGGKVKFHFDKEEKHFHDHAEEKSKMFHGGIVDPTLDFEGEGLPDESGHINRGISEMNHESQPEELAEALHRAANAVSSHFQGMKEEINEDETSAHEEMEYNAPHGGILAEDAKRALQLSKSKRKYY